jgi:hypothetical protein
MNVKNLYSVSLSVDMKISQFAFSQPETSGEASPTFGHRRMQI